jgi:hypothetical protein
MKLMKACIFILLALLSFFTFLLFESEDSIAALKLYASPSLQLDKDLIEDYEKGDSDAKRAAELEIIETTLKNLEYSKWKDYIEYMELQLYKGQVLPNSSSQLLAAVNLSGDQALVAIYTNINDNYVYHTSITDLAPIESLQLIPFEAGQYKYIAINQILDERLGAFFLDKYTQLYLYFENGFKRVWHQSTFFEDTYKEVWINPRADETIWNRVREETQIEFLIGVPLRINTTSTYKKMTASSMHMPQPSEFKVVEVNAYRSSYYWHHDYSSFIMAELTQEVFITRAALVEDMEYSRAALYGIANKTYRLITQNGEVIYLPKAKFKGLFKNSLEE